MSVQGQPVNTPSEMIYRMSVVGVGETAQVGIYRQGETLEVAVALAEAPDVPSRDETTLGRGALLDGLRVARVNPAIISQYNLALEAQGVVVAETGRLGRRAGLRRGDVIEEVNGEKISHPDDLVRVMSKGTRSYSVTVLRGNDRRVLQFRS